MMVINVKLVSVLWDYFDYGDNMSLRVSVPSRHAPLIEKIIAFFSLETDLFLDGFKGNSFQLLKGMQSTMTKPTEGERGMMEGEKIIKEPVGEVDKWKGRDKVWNQLETGGISKYIEKLHGYDPKVTNNMVNS